MTERFLLDDRGSSVRPLARSVVAGTFALAVLGVAPCGAQAATFVLQNVDPPGVGFNDPTPAAPVGGNTGTTLGEQRLIAFQYAADLWGGLVDSPVPIEIEASFKPLECTATMADAGRGGPLGVQQDVAGLPPGVLVPDALANSVAGVDLTPGEAEIHATFNGDLPACIGLDWYYGLDAQAPEWWQLDLVESVIHEVAHGLGFMTFVDVETGEQLYGAADVYSMHVLDNLAGRHWHEMTDAERAISASRVRQLVWDGENVTRTAAEVLDVGAPVISLEPPLAGFSGVVSEANFGPKVADAPVTAPLAVGSPLDGCSELAPVDGGVALVTGEGCSYLEKALYAAEAGAVAMLMVDEQGVEPPAPVEAYLDEVAAYPVSIPVLGITMADAELLQAAVGAGVTVSLTADHSRLVGADEQGRVYLSATNPVMLHSTASHWDPLVRPDLVLEAERILNHGHDLRMEAALLYDIGWAPPRCGNGKPDPGEECDDGSDNSDTEPDACRRDCTLPSCGDGVVDSAEECDDGITGGDSCNSCEPEEGNGPDDPDTGDDGCACRTSSPTQRSPSYLAPLLALGLLRRRRLRQRQLLLLRELAAGRRQCESGPINPDLAR